MFHLFFKVINTMFEDAKRQGCRASRLLFLLQNHVNLSDLKLQADNCHSSFQAVWEHHAKLEGAGANFREILGRLFLMACRPQWWWVAGLHLHQVQIHECLLEGPTTKTVCWNILWKLKERNVSKILAAGFYDSQAGIPMAPTIFAFKGQRTPAKLLKEIKDSTRLSESVQIEFNEVYCSSISSTTWAMKETPGCLGD